MDIRVRVAVEEDAEVVCTLLRRSITDCCSADHLDDPQRLAAWLANKTVENVRRWITASETRAVVAESAAGVVGVAMMLTSGAVTLLYVLPEALHQEVGKSMLVGLEAAARHLGLQTLRLNSTRTALPFYARSGYRPSGDPVSHLGIEAYPMEKVLDP